MFVHLEFKIMNDGAQVVQSLLIGIIIYYGQYATVAI